MKARKREVTVEENFASANEQARSEIQSFLQALDSYPDRFARDPQITFDEYCANLIRAAQSDRA